MWNIVAVAVVAIILIALIVMMFVTQRKPADDHSKEFSEVPADKVYIVRYYRESCPYCVNSQAEWLAFTHSPVEREYYPLNIDTNNNSLATRYWLSKYSVTGVPTIVKFINKKTIEYMGPMTASELLKWAKAT